MRSETVDDPSVPEPDRLPLNGYEVVTFSVDDLDIPFDLHPRYVVTGDWAVLGTTLSSLERFHKAASGSVESLRNAPQFKNLVETLPEPLHFVTYADIAAMAAMVEEALPEDTRLDYREEVKPFLNPFSAMLLSYSVTEEQVRFTARMLLTES